jgi:hypothetical protein
MRRAAVIALALAAVGTVGLVIAALATSTTRALTIGVISSQPSPPIRAGQEACQKPIAVAPGADFDRVDFEVGNFHREHGPPLDVIVRPVEGSSPFPVRRGLLPAGYPDVGVVQRHVVEVGHVPGRTVVEVCFHNRGPGPVALFGGNDGQATASSGYIAGQPVGFDYDLVMRRESESFAALIPRMTERLALFRPPWVAPALYYVLLVILLVGVPLLLARALRTLE